MEPFLVFHEKPIILVVDDTPDNLSLMTDLLKDDYRVKVAISGERALKLVQAQPLEINAQGLPVTPASHTLESRRGLQLRVAGAGPQRPEHSAQRRLGLAKHNRLGHGRVAAQRGFHPLG